MNQVVSSEVIVEPRPAELVPNLSGEFDQANLAALAADMGNNIRDNGDILDRIAWHKMGRAVIGTGLVSYTAIGAYVGSTTAIGSASEMSYSYPGTMVALVGASFLTNWIAPVFSRRAKAKEIAPIIQQSHELASYFEGEPVSILRDKQNDLQVFWEGPSDPETFLSAQNVNSRLVNLKVVAEATGTSRIVLPANVVKDYGHGLADQAARTWTRDQMLKANKTRTLIDKSRGQEPVITVSVDELDTMIENSAQAEIEEPLHTIMNLLRQRIPSHPLLQSYYASIKSSPTESQKFERQTRRLLERRLEDIEAQRVLASDHDEPIYEKQKQHFVGQPIIGKDGLPRIIWRNQTNFTDIKSGDLLEHLGVSWSELEQLPMTADSLSTSRLNQLCTLGVWLALNDKLGGMGVSESGIVQEIADQPLEAPQVELQASLEERAKEYFSIGKYKDRWTDGKDTIREPNQIKRIRRLGMKSAAIIMTSIIGGTLVTGALRDRALEEQRQSAEGVSPNDPLFKTYQGIETGAYWWADKTYTGFTALEKLLFNIEPDQTYDQEQQEKIDKINGRGQTGTVDNGTSQIGNANDGANKPVWQITSNGGMDSEGYWAEEAFSHLSVDTGGSNGPDAMHWSPSYFGMAGLTQEEYEALKTNIYNQAELPLPIDTSSNQPYLTVSRQIYIDTDESLKTQAEDSYSYSDPMGDDHFYVPVPVLDGTDVVAASANGKPVRLVSLKDGLRALWVAGDPKHKDTDIVFQLGPSKDHHVKASLVATSNGDIIDNSPLNQIWANHGVPEALGSDAAARIDAETIHLQNFDYRLAPISDDNALKTPSDYAQHVLDSRVGNCNTVNGLMVMSNPEYLNLATGYSNSNNQEQTDKGTYYLSTSEMHAWSVGADGDIIDATPQNGLTAEEAKHFEENGFNGLEKTSHDSSSTRNYVFGGAAALTAAYMYRKRRGMAKAASNLAANTHKRYAGRRLAMARPGQLSLASEAADYALFAGTDLSSEKLGQLKQRAVKDKDSSLDSLETLVAHHDKTTQKALFKSALQQARGWRARRAVKQAGKIASWTQLTATE